MGKKKKGSNKKSKILRKSEIKTTKACFASTSSDSGLSDRSDLTKPVTEVVHYESKLRSATAERETKSTQVLQPDRESGCSTMYDDPYSSPSSQPCRRQHRPPPPPPRRSLDYPAPRDEFLPSTSSSARDKYYKFSDDSSEAYDQFYASRSLRMNDHDPNQALELYRKPSSVPAPADSNLDRDYAQLNSKYKKLKYAYANMMEENSDLRKTVIDIRAVEYKLAKAVDHGGRRVKSLKTQVADLEEEKTELLAKIERLKDSANGYKSENFQLLSDAEDLKKLFETSKASHQEELKALERNIKVRYHTELGKHRSHDSGKICAEINRSKEKIAHLQMDVSRLMEGKKRVERRLKQCIEINGFGSTTGFDIEGMLEMVIEFLELLSDENKAYQTKVEALTLELEAYRAPQLEEEGGEEWWGHTEPPSKLGIKVLCNEDGSFTVLSDDPAAEGHNFQEEANLDKDPFLATLRKEGVIFNEDDFEFVFGNLLNRSKVDCGAPLDLFGVRSDLALDYFVRHPVLDKVYKTGPKMICAPPNNGSLKGNLAGIPWNHDSVNKVLFAFATFLQRQAFARRFDRKF